MQTVLFDYRLPPKLIAQIPAVPRDSSRLLVYNRQTEKIRHDFFYNLPQFLRPGDVLVFNDTKVFPARLILSKPTGGKIEVFLLQNLGHGQWECLIGGKIKEKQELRDKNQAIGRVESKNKNGSWVVEFNLSENKFKKFLNQFGQTPLPPYIKTRDSKKIRQAYQTVYARHQGSVAAPTAGLHFTQKLLSQLNKKGVQCEFVTLHVGWGTFAPIKTKNITTHQLHAEYVVLDKKTCQRLNSAKQAGRRIVAVGTTTVRVLESAVTPAGKLKPQQGWINIFIYPGYQFKFVDALITNFHLPRSSLLMLISAFIQPHHQAKKYGVKKNLEIYQQAIQKKYRFYSFGDAMLII